MVLESRSMEAAADAEAGARGAVAVVLGGDCVPLLHASNAKTTANAQPVEHDFIRGLVTYERDLGYRGSRPSLTRAFLARQHGLTRARVRAVVAQPVQHFASVASSKSQRLPAGERGPFPLERRRDASRSKPRQRHRSYDAGRKRCANQA